MASQNFRSAFNGFNREDVVHFIEYLNAKHTAELNELNAELDLLRSRSAAAPDADLRKELNAALEACDLLQEQLADLQQRYDALAAEKAAAPVPSAESRFGAAQELEAYRRAERTERIARERAEQVYHQANGALADATVKVDEAFSQISTLADQVNAQLSQLQQAVTGSRQALADAAATLYTIRPNDDNR